MDSFSPFSVHVSKILSHSAVNIQITHSSQKKKKSKKIDSEGSIPLSKKKSTQCHDAGITRNHATKKNDVKKKKYKFIEIQNLTVFLNLCVTNTFFLAPFSSDRINSAKKKTIRKMFQKSKYGDANAE